MDQSKEISKYLLIADLAGYTAMTEAHGSFSAAQIVTKFNDIVQNSLDRQSTLVEQVGDEVFILSEDPRSIILSALEILSSSEREAYFPKVHIGIHHGKVLKHEGRYFGSALNLTSRLAARAQGGQIMCSKIIKDNGQGIKNIKFEEVGKAEFKNIKDPIEIFNIIPLIKSEDTDLIDPVCRMQISPDSAISYITYKERTFYFCSIECKNKFLEDPDHYFNMMNK